MNLQENRSPLLAIIVWACIYFMDALVSQSIDGGLVLCQLGTLLIALVILPLYLTTRWNLGEAAIFLGFGLIFWGLGDYVCSSSGFGTGGVCFLLRHWYPSSFTVLMRIFAGAILIVYLVLNPDIGAGTARLPGLSREEGLWGLKVGLLVAALMGAGWLAYRGVARSGFGGDVLYVLTGEYGELDQPELIYGGFLGLLQQSEGGSGHVLIREHLNLTNLPIGRMGGAAWDTEVLGEYLGLEVEVLGKLSEYLPDEPRLLFPGRIRAAAE